MMLRDAVVYAIFFHYYAAAMPIIIAFFATPAVRLPLRCDAAAIRRQRYISAVAAHARGYAPAA